MVINKNIAIIFAGGYGRRMHHSDFPDVPKQFLEIYGKPIIIRTLEHFENHEEIDGIIIVCIDSWIHHLNELLKEFKINKVVSVVKGGDNGQESIFNGLKEAERRYSEDSVVLIHDGVRPIINKKIISSNIETVRKHGTAVTTAPPIETFITTDSNNFVAKVHDRSLSRNAKAPQSFFLKDIIRIHRKAIEDKYFNAIDSCSLMYKYGYEIKLVEGISENIKVTTKADYYMLKGILNNDLE